MRTATYNSHSNHYATRMLPKAKKAYVKLLKSRALWSGYKSLQGKRIATKTFKAIKRHPIKSFGAALATISAFSGLWMLYKSRR